MHFTLRFTPFGCSSNRIQPIEKSPDGEGLDVRPITVLAGCRAASARHRMNSKFWIVHTLTGCPVFYNTLYLLFETESGILAPKIHAPPFPVKMFPLVLPERNAELHAFRPFQYLDNNLIYTFF